MVGLNLRFGLSRSSGAAAFDPATLSPTAWYDPSDLSTVFQDAAGTTQAGNGDFVRRINDKSGNGNHLLLDGGDANRPTLVQSGSLWAIDFDGNDSLAGAFGVSIPQPTFIALALKADSVSGTQAPLDNHSAGSGDRQHFNMVSGNWGMFATSATLTIGAATTSAQVISGNFNGASSVGYLDGVAGSTGNPGAAASGGLRLGTANDGASAPYAGLFYGLIFIPRTPTASERAAIHTYLGAKAGLTL